MATIKSGILGGFQGKVGTVVGSTWRGRDIIRSLPKSSGKNPTELQQLQRVKFKAVTTFLNPLRTPLGVYFGSASGVRSRFNLATAYHLTDAVEVTDGVAKILYPRVLVAKGTLFGFQNLTVSHAGTDITLEWEDNIVLGNAKAEDVVNVVCYSEVYNTFLVFQNVAMREALSATVSLPQNFTGTAVELYAFIYDPVTKTASTSVYLGNIAF